VQAGDHLNESEPRLLVWRGVKVVGVRKGILIALGFVEKIPGAEDRCVFLRMHLEAHAHPKISVVLNVGFPDISVNLGKEKRTGGAECVHILKQATASSRHGSLWAIGKPIIEESLRKIKGSALKFFAEMPKRRVSALNSMEGLLQIEIANQMKRS
jgi:hypothetical protein